MNVFIESIAPILNIRMKNFLNILGCGQLTPLLRHKDSQIYLRAALLFVSRRMRRTRKHGRGQVFIISQTRAYKIRRVNGRTRVDQMEENLLSNVILKVCSNFYDTDHIPRKYNFVV